jgi:heme/copper-type cytochrome/quinol oxidase subunit 3
MGVAHRGRPAVTAVEAAGVEVVQRPPVPASAGRSYPVGWWGMGWVIVTEAMVFAALLSGWFFLWAQSPDWPQGGIEKPHVGRILLFTVVLLGSSIPVVWGERQLHRGRVGRLRIALLLTFLMGAVFLVNQLLEYQQLPYTWTDNAYASMFYVITGLHGLHVLVGLVMNLVVQAKAWTGRVSPERDLTVRLWGMYWHFVDGVWIFVLSSLYLAVRWWA